MHSWYSSKCTRLLTSSQLPLLQSPYASHTSLVPRETNGKANDSPNGKTNGVTNTPFKHSAPKENFNEGPAPDFEEDEPAADNNPHGFTPAEDAELTRLKEFQGKDVKSWKVIADEMGRTKPQLQDRWKVINPNRKDGGNEKKDSPAGSNDKAVHKKAVSDKATEKVASEKAEVKAADDKAKDKAERAKMWKEKAAKEKAAKENGANNMVKEQANDLGKAKWKAEQDHYSKVDAAAHMMRYGRGKQGNEVAHNQDYKAASVVTRASSATYLELEEDDLFTFGDISALANIIENDENYLWQRVAAVFFDRTGRRVLPQDIRDKFEPIRP